MVAHGLALAFVLGNEPRRTLAVVVGKRFVEPVGTAVLQACLDDVVFAIADNASAREDPGGRPPTPERLTAAAPPSGIPMVPTG